MATAKKAPAHTVLLVGPNATGETRVFQGGRRYFHWGKADFVHCLKAFYNFLRDTINSRYFYDPQLCYL